MSVSTDEGLVPDLGAVRVAAGIPEGSVVAVPRYIVNWYVVESGVVSPSDENARDVLVCAGGGPDRIHLYYFPALGTRGAFVVPIAVNGRPVDPLGAPVLRRGRYVRLGLSSGARPGALAEELRRAAPEPGSLAGAFVWGARGWSRAADVEALFTPRPLLVPRADPGLQRSVPGLLVVEWEGCAADPPDGTGRPDYWVVDPQIERAIRSYEAYGWEVVVATTDADPDACMGITDALGCDTCPGAPVRALALVRDRGVHGTIVVVSGRPNSLVMAATFAAVNGIPVATLLYHGGALHAFGKTREECVLAHGSVCPFRRAPDRRPGPGAPSQ